MEPRGTLVARLRADINPIAWKAPTAFAVRRHGKMSAGVAPSMEVNAYKQALAEILGEQWGERSPITTAVCLQWRFNRRLVTYESASGRQVTKHRQDLSNMVKAAEDALQPHIIKNDVQVQSFSALLVRQEKDVTDPYVEVAIWLLDPE